MSITVNLTVNGKAVTQTCPANTTLVDLLREQLLLTGTHVGCDTTQCGACTIHFNGRAARLGANTVYEVEHYYASGPHGMSAPFLCYPRMPVE